MNGEGIFKGRYFTANGTLVAVHTNPAATKGNRVERYLGHPIATQDDLAMGVGVGQRIQIHETIRICWNENGECVWVQGIAINTSAFDLVQSVKPESIEAGVRVKGCKECEI